MYNIGVNSIKGAEMMVAIRVNNNNNNLNALVLMGSFIVVD